MRFWNLLLIYSSWSDAAKKVDENDTARDPQPQPIGSRTKLTGPIWSADPTISTFRPGPYQENRKFSN